MSKKIEKTKEVIAKIVKEGISQFLWNWEFNIRAVASRLEFHALKGENLWASDVLESVLTPYREHVKRQGLDEAAVDADLKFLSDRIGVPHDKLRKQFYILEFEQPEKVEPAKAPQKVEPKSTTKQQEEIVVQGAKEE